MGARGRNNNKRINSQACVIGVFRPAVQLSFHRPNNPDRNVVQSRNPRHAFLLLAYLTYGPNRRLAFGGRRAGCGVCLVVDGVERSLLVILPTSDDARR